MNDRELGDVIIETYEGLMDALEIFASVAIANDDLIDPECMRVPRAAFQRLGDEMLRMGNKYKALMEKEMAE